MKDRNQPCFVGNDLAPVLGLPRFRQAVTMVSDDQQAMVRADLGSGRRDMIVVSLQGLKEILIDQAKRKGTADRPFVLWLAEAIKKIPAFMQSDLDDVLVALQDAGKFWLVDCSAFAKARC